MSEIPDLLAALQRSVDAAKRARAERQAEAAREPCADCHHTHTPEGCAGPPSPSDLWAGVSPAGCDCDYDHPAITRGTDRPATTNEQGADHE